MALHDDPRSVSEDEQWREIYKAAGVIANLPPGFCSSAVENRPERQNWVRALNELRRFALRLIVEERNANAPAKWGEPSAEERHILQFFEFEHFPGPLLANTVMPFRELAHAIVEGREVLSPSGDTVTLDAIPRNPERIVALRKLLEAKDAAVRAKLAAPNA